ncbi:hypothetical protein [Edaphobacter aggregans]|uniref:hypothetical protein n=1 Tax=Edaphobacter aggregans TaxID=570835 RepID=UPI0005527BF8|nr:hypothetical protein [Edaphobacter aggregans]
MIWLGKKRGNLSDWTTQRWVQATGRRLVLSEYPWLDGPTGNTLGIGQDFFLNYARDQQLELITTGVRGLLPTFSLLEGNRDLHKVAPLLREFYERTSEFDLDAWSEWSSLFRPFGRALGLLFSRRLQQLNVPLSSLDSSKGMTSNVLPIRDPGFGTVVQTAWVRELRVTKNVLYAGSYSVCMIPEHPYPCIKVVFPLPNGNAIVLMKVEVHEDGSLSIQSIGDRFGEPGFYFVVHQGNGVIWARYVKAMKEEIRVYAGETEVGRADHLMVVGKSFSAPSLQNAATQIIWPRLKRQPRPFGFRSDYCTLIVMVCVLRSNWLVA